MKLIFALVLSAVLAMAGAQGATRQDTRVSAGANLPQIVLDFPAGALGTLTVGPGDYLIPTNTQSLLKNGLNWHFENGARLLTGNSGDAGARVLFSDYARGAVTSTVTGWGEFHMTNGNGTILAVTNGASVITFEALAVTAATNLHQTAGSASANFSRAGLGQNIVYLNAGQSNSFIAKVAAAPPGTMFMLGPGVWAINGFVDVANPNVTFKGSGRDVTTLWFPSAGFAINAGTTIQDLSIIATNSPIRVDFYECTNSLIERCRLRGGIDVIFPGVSLLSPGIAYTLRDCILQSTWDFVILSGLGGELGIYNVENCVFIADMLEPMVTTGNSLNSSRLTRFFSSGAGNSMGILNVKNCNFFWTNTVAPNLYEFGDAGTALETIRATFENCTWTGAVTNGGKVIPYEWVATRGGTNSFISFLNCPKVTTITNTVAYTNLYGPELVIMTSTVARTNWLPDIAFGGKERYSFEVTVKDGNGNAGAANVQVEATGGATIDGAARVAITANYGSVTVMPRPGTTNWMVLSRGQ